MTKLINNHIKLSVDSIASYQQTQKFLQENNVTYHIYALSEERTLKVLYKRIPSSLNEQDVESELSNIGFTVIHVRQFLKEGRQLPMFMNTQV